MGWGRRLRFAAEAVALALVASACSVSNPVVGPPQPGGGGSGHGGPTASGSGGSTRPRPPTTRSRPGQTATGIAPAAGSAAYQDDAGVGAMSRTFLRASPATSLLVEFDWVAGREPVQSALDHLSSILRRELLKPNGIALERSNQVSSDRSSWSLSDLAALERANRNHHSSGSRATMWFCYVGGSFADNPNALAVTFSASAVIVFRDRINDATSSLVLEPAIERSVITHEAGHLLALINIGYRSRYDHEDPQHPHHSNNPNSVMYWAVEDISIRNLVRGGPPDDFDSADRADLAMLRGS